MGKGRLEAFSDGVIAIIITIMVLELRVPDAPTLDALAERLPVFFTYALSFIYIGIYWNNHHHMLHAAHSIDGRILWSNLHLLFWLSLIPFATAWMDESQFATLPVVMYGVALWMCGFAYFILSRMLIAHEGRESQLAKAVGKDWKSMVSVFCYTLAIALAFVNPWLSVALYIAVAGVWFIPDRRIERAITHP